MIKQLLLILGLIALALIIWIGWSYHLGNIEEPSYKVALKTGSYEIRQYDPYLIAWTEVSGPYKKSANEAFRILADYIFGNNQGEVSMAMTKPVTGIKMPMTKPVIGQKLDDKIDFGTQEGTDSYRTSFVLPNNFTLQTVPRPQNSAVHIEQVPARKMAVLEFGGYVSHKKMNEKIAELVKALKKDGITISGQPQIARYNPPFAFPLMMRNEIMIEVE